VKIFDPKIEVVDQLWPKLFAPDYTESITKMLQVKPQAVYSALWGGDLVAFIEQSNLYRLFANTGVLQRRARRSACPVGDQAAAAGAEHRLPLQSQLPVEPENTAYADGFMKIAGHESTNWGWQNYVAMQFVFEALRRTKRQDGRVGSRGRDQGHDGQVRVRRGRQLHHARHRPHDHQLPGRMGPDGAEGALGRGLQGRPLVQDPRARGAVEEEQGIRLSAPAWLRAASARSLDVLHCGRAS
jgi:hypothetical protein